MSKKKKLAIAAAVAFAAFYLLTKPAQAGKTVSGLFDGVITAAGQLSVFLTNISL
jgi:hypothetical protein